MPSGVFVLLGGAMGSNMVVDGAMVSRLYRQLKFIRRFEEVIAEIYPTDKIKSPVHLSIGQEAVAVGVCDVLRASDKVSGTYRGHAAYLAKGGDPQTMMAELYGRDTGCCRGKGGSMHIVGIETGVLGTSAVVGSTVPIAMGYAFVLQREGRGDVVVAFHGDGASEEGVFWESLNFAVLKQLPILFVCENNGLAIHEPLSKRWGATDICAKVRAFGVPAQSIESGCVFEIRDSADAAVTAMRAGEGPRFIECKTYRWREHVGPGDDHGAGYRSREDLVRWQVDDQVARLAAMIDIAQRSVIDARIEDEIADAVHFAETSPDPELGELAAHVFAS